MKLEPARIALPRKTRLIVEVPRMLLDRLIRPHRVLGRVCDEEFRISAASQSAIEELLRQAKDELGWDQATPAPASTAPAASGPEEP